MNLFPDLIFFLSVSKQAFVELDYLCGTILQALEVLSIPVSLQNGVVVSGSGSGRRAALQGG